jgi:hypothetical protein
MNMSEAILIKPISQNGVVTPAVQEIRVAELFIVVL